MLWTAATRVGSVQRSPAAIVNLALLLELAVATLPPGAEDEIVLIEHLPGRRVHLQDFFWTGVEDAPSWLDPNQILTLYQTHTIHHTATVYIPEDSTRPQNPDTGLRQPIDCTSCIEPTPTFINDIDQNIGVLLDDDPGPRYWLLTVLKAGESVPSKVELRLAKLYKTAFTRQQQRHLGLLPEIQTRKSFPKRQVLAQNQTMNIVDNVTDATTTPTTTTSEERMLPEPSMLRMRTVRIAKSRRALPVPEPEPESRNESTPRTHALPNVGLVQVRMHNTSLTEAGATKLIYTVHLGGKPVPAETAAKDMALLSAQEVALELGAPVLVQSEPYLKESRPLALSRKRDAWLLVGATGAGVLVLLIVVVGLLLVTKRKRAQGSNAAPTNRRILIKDEEYAPTTPGIDNTAYTSETEARTEATNVRRRPTPGNLSITPGSQDTRDFSIENEQKRDQEYAKSWDMRGYTEIGKAGAGGRRVRRGNVIDRPQSSDFVDSATAGGSRRPEILDSLEKGFGPKEVLDEEEEEEVEEEEVAEGEGEEEEEEATGSPHSYLSMPSCKQFPNMRSVEPLSKVLEPAIVRRLDEEPDSPEMKTRENGEHFFSRASSAAKDPGVLGPIVWDLKRKRAVEGNVKATSADLESGYVPHGPVGRARKRLNELIEDSFNLFGSRETKLSRNYPHRQHQLYERRQELDPQDTSQQQRHSLLVENRGKSAQVSHVVSSNFEDTLRPRTSLTRNDISECIPETGQMGPHPRGAWGSRPLSAGPFHRPTLPVVDVARVLANSQLRPEDPAVPLISAIKKELGKFTYE